MNTFSVLQKKQSNIYKLKNVLLGGFLVRLVVFVFIFTIGLTFSEPYFLSDDISYEQLAKYYMLNANSVLDLDLFDRMTVGYMQQFWPFVECFCAKLFNNMYAARVVNILLSTACIAVIYKLTYEVCENEATSLRAAKLFAYLPISVLTCCFPIKDIYITLGVMYAFYTFVCIQNGKKITLKQIVLCVALLVGVYLSRGAVVELLLIFLFIYYLQKLMRQKKNIQAVLLIVIAVIIFLFFSKTIFSSFQTKYDDYSGYEGTGEGIEFIRVTGLSNIYKLPLAYAFATIQPMKLNLFTVDDNIWLAIISYANMTIYPIAVGNFLYVFSKKHNLFFWLSSFVMFSGVIMLSLGIFRHYLFMIPITMINYSLYIERDPHNNTTFSNVGALVLIIIILLASALNIF